MNIPAYWDGFAKLHETAFIGEPSYAAALEFLERDQQEKATTAFRDWAGKASDPSAIVRAAALFDVARARRAFINHNLDVATSTLNATAWSVPENIVLAVLIDYVSAGGDEALLGTWLKRTARSGKLASKLTDLLGSPARVSALFNLLSPTSASTALSAIDEASFDALTDGGFARQLCELAMLAVFDPRAQRLAKPLSSFGKTRTKGTETQLSVLLILAHPMLSPRTFASIDWVKLAKKLAAILDESSGTAAVVQGGSDAPAGAENAARAVYDHLAERYAAPADTDEPSATRRAERQYAQAIRCLSDLDAARVDDGSFDALLDEAGSIGIPEPRLREFHLLKAVSKRSLEQPCTVADLLHVKDRAGLELADLLSIVRPEDLCRKEAWTKLDVEDKRRLTESAPFAVIVRAIAEEIANQHFEGAAETVEWVTDAALVLERSERSSLISPILNFLDELTASGALSVSRSRVLARRLWISSTDGDRDLFATLDADYANFSSSKTFAGLWRDCALHEFAVGTLDGNPQTIARMRAGLPREGQSVDEPLSSRIALATFVGDHDLALKTLRAPLPKSSLSQPERTALSDYAHRLALSYGDAGDARKAGIALATAASLGLASFMSAALEIGRLGKAAPQSQYLSDVLARNDTISFYLRLTELMPATEALSAIEALPLHYLTSLQAWQRAATDPERLNHGAAAVAALLHSLNGRDGPGWEPTAFAIDMANIVLGDLTPDSRVLIAEGLADLVGRDEAATPSVDAARTDWLRPVWLAALARGDKERLVRLGQVLSRVSGAHRMVVAVVLEDLSPVQFGNRLLAGEQANPVELALALFGWLEPRLGQQCVEQLPAPALVAVPAWTSVFDGERVLRRDREGVRRTIDYIIAEVDAFEQLVPLLAFFGRTLRDVPVQARPQVLDLIAPLCERLVREGDEIGNPEPRRIERTLYGTAAPSDSTAVSEGQRRAAKRSRLFRLSRRPHVDASLPLAEADDLLEDSSFVLSDADQEARLRLLFLLHRDEQALKLAEHVDPPKDDVTGLGQQAMGAVERRFAATDTEGAWRAIAVAAKFGASTDTLHAYDLLSGNGGADVQQRARHVIGSRSGLLVLAEMQRIDPGHPAAALDRLPLAAFGPPTSAALENKELAASLAQAAPAVADVCSRLSNAATVGADELALATYLSGTVAPLVHADHVDGFGRALGTLVDRLATADDPVGGDARAIRDRGRSFEKADETSAYQHYASDFVERILADGLVDEVQDRADATELLDQAERTGEVLSRRLRIWLTATSGRIATLAPIIENGGLAALQNGETGRLQNFLFSNAIADVAAGRSTDLSSVKFALGALAKSPELELLLDWLAYWSAHSQLPYLKQLKNRSADSTALAVTISAIEHLPADYRIAFCNSLPAFVLGSSAQWSDKKLARTVSRHPSSILCVLESMTNRLMGDERDSMRQAAEAFAKTLLPTLPQPIRLACHGYLVTMEHALNESNQRSATLKKAYAGAIAPAELNKILAHAAKNFGPDVAGAIIMSRALMTRRRDKLIEIIPQFELYGGFEQARSIVAPLLKSDASMEAAFADLRLAYALGDRDGANQQARAIVRSTKETQLSVMDRLRLTVFAPVLKGKRTRLLRRLTGLRSARQRIAQAQAAARASLILDDPQQTRERFSHLTSFSLHRYAPSEIGVLILLRDFAGAESITTRLIDRLQASKGSRPIAILQKLEQILPLIGILQSHFLNEGRDPLFFSVLKARVFELTPTRTLQTLKSSESRTLTSVLIKLLRLSLRGTSPDQAFDTHCIETVLTASNGDDTICVRLGQTLASHWHQRGAEIGHRALVHAVDALNGPATVNGTGEKKPREVLKIDLASIDIREASQLAKSLSTVLSLAERMNDDATIATYSPLAEKLLETAVPRKWSSNSTIIALANRALTTFDDVGAVISFMEAAYRIAPNSFELIKALAAASMVNGQNARAKQLVQKALQRSPNDRSLLTLLARAHENNAEIGDALKANTKALNILEGWALQRSEDGDLVNSVLALRNTIAVQKFWIDTSKVTHFVPSPRGEKIKGVVFASFYRCMASASITSMPFLELKKRGYDIVYLNSGTLSAEPTGHKLLDQFSSIIHGDGSFVRGVPSNRAKLFHNWVIEPEKRQIIVNGLNFYQPIFERLTQESRSFTLDFSSDVVGHRMRGMILRCDRALYVAERIRNEVAAQGIPVRFVSANWQYPPYCTFRIACQAWGKDYDMSFVAVAPGYESYFSNLGKKYATTAAVVNMTRNPTARAPFLPLGDKFVRWFATNQDVVHAARDEIRAQIQADRAGTGSTMSPEAKACFERVREHRARGGKVVCAFGKIVYDLSVPYAGGPAHTDMADYLNHTIEAATKAPDTLLMVKPHPHELRYEIARNPREYFTDLIKVPIPPNVVLLGHRWFNVRDIIKMIDLGVLWNGTTSIELGASGIPVVMCDDWGPWDYPVGHAAPRDRAHYEAIIKDPSIVQVDEAYQLRCAGLIKYMSTTDVMRPYEFVTRGLVNVDVGPPVWHHEPIQEFLKNGDEFVSALADDFGF